MEPSIEAGLVEMVFPERPTHQDQRYRLTDKGIRLKKQLEETIRKR